MDSLLLSHLLLPLLIAIFFAINMGGSGTAPSFSAAYRANVIRKSLIPGIFGLMVLIGSIVAGKNTATTLGKGLINPDLLNYIIVSIILLSITISLLISNILGIPQSTSQVTVLAVVAPAIYFNELAGGYKQKLFYDIIPAWFYLPIISFVVCLLIGKYIYKPMRRRGYTISKKFNENRALKGAVILMSLYVAFSIGANNVANATGPIATMITNELHLYQQDQFKIILILCTLIVAPSFGIGSSIFGYKVVSRTSNEIVLFGRFEAVIIAFVSATLLIFASHLGIPTSLVQINVGAIIGIGVAKLGYKNIFRKTEVRQFFLMWIIAPIISFVLSFSLTALADSFDLL